MKNLRSLLAAALLSASLLSPMKSFSDKQTIFNETYSVPMLSENGEKIQEELKIKADLDSELNTLYLDIYTQNYNRKNWIGSKEISLPVPKRHTSINYNFSRMFIFKPQRVKIKEQEQRAYTVPKYKWSSELESYEDSQTSQLMIETSDTILDRLLSSIPLLNKIYEKYIENTEEKEEEYYDEMLEEINEDYVKLRIFPYIPKDLIGQTETARQYTIKFDAGNIQDIIPMFLYMKIALGDPSQASYGSFPNKYGELENILIEFNLNEDKVKREELYAYFFHGDELEHLDVAKKDVPGTKSNPAVITIESLGLAERVPYEEDKIARIGKGEYILHEMGDSTEKQFSLSVIQFETVKDREDFVQRGRLRYPSFFRESILSSISKPTIEDVLNPLEMFNEEQLSAYFDLVLSYSTRTGMQILLSENEYENQELLKAIKEQQINSETE